MGYVVQTSDTVQLMTGFHMPIQPVEMESNGGSLLISMIIKIFLVNSTFHPVYGKLLIKMEMA